MSDSLSNIFDVEPVITETVPTVIPNGNEDTDFDVARANYFELIDASKAAVNTAIRIAAESENPRAIEVLSGLLKNAADINRQLIMLSKDRQEVKIAKIAAKSVNTNQGQNTQPQITSQNTIVFSGTSADLSRLLNEK